jgi:hypothetical protein
MTQSGHGATPLPQARGAYTAAPINTIIEAGNEGLFAMKANHLGAATLALRSVVSGEFDPADYSLAVKRRGRPAKPWRWEIYCPCKTVPVERSAIFFESMAEAAKEGKRALARLRV